MDQTAPRKLSKKGSAALLQAGPVCCYMAPVPPPSALSPSLCPDPALQVTNGTTDEQIVITGSGLSAYDAQGKYLYPCTVWTTAQDYAKGAYGTFLASRVRDVINGQAALAVVGGGVSVESMSSLIAQVQSPPFPSSTPRACLCAMPCAPVWLLWNSLPCLAFGTHAAPLL